MLIFIKITSILFTLIILPTLMYAVQQDFFLNFKSNRSIGYKIQKWFFFIISQLGNIAIALLIYMIVTF